MRFNIKLWLFVTLIVIGDSNGSKRKMHRRWMSPKSKWNTLSLDEQHDNRYIRRCSLNGGDSNGNGHIGCGNNMMGAGNGRCGENGNSVGQGNCGSNGGLRMNNYGANSKLRASNIALTAAQEAKSASDAQASAAEAAARRVKSELAEKAMAAARAAEAAMTGKQQIAEQLEQEVHEAEIIVQEEMASLTNTQANAEIAMQAANQAQQQFEIIKQAMKLSQDSVLSTEAASNGAQQELAEKVQLVEAAKKRVEMLCRQLHVARADYVATRQAALNASCAAKQAKEKVMRNRRSHRPYV